jgi:hypothetical protein
MSAKPIEIPQGDQWKDPAYVERWRKQHRDRIDALYQERIKYEPFLVTELQKAHDAIGDDFERLTTRARRLESGAKKTAGISPDQARHQVPALIAYDREWILHPAVKRATPPKLEKSKKMYRLGLEKKAQREIACGLLGGEIHCQSGHKFLAAYRCGNRYCSRCAPIDGKKLFARQADRLRFVATRMMLCGVDECEECSKAIEEKRLPHWPPPREIRPRVVCAKIDFTLKHDRRDGMPTPERMKQLNAMIKKFCRAIERRFKISRKEYGLAYCDELGGNNSNPHAHAIYVGPWLPQSKERKELSQLWREISGDSFILSIKFARNFTEALFHAVKYPAKFATRSSPGRLADLEAVFHRVRRFHTLAAFYAPEVPPKETPPAKKCPICDARLSEPRGWNTIEDLSRRGLKDIEDVRAAIERARGLGDRSPP